MQLGKVMLRLQRERDQLVLYNSQIGADSKTFLVRSYVDTDRVLASMTDWPVKKTNSTPPEFSSKVRFVDNCRVSFHIVVPDRRKGRWWG